MKTYVDKFEEANSKILDVFGGGDTVSFVNYLFTMRSIAEKADTDPHQTDKDICNIVIKMASLLDAMKKV